MSVKMSRPALPATSFADEVLQWPGASGPLTVRVYRGTRRPSPVLMVFFPPGGFVRADLDAADDCLKGLAVTCGITVVAPGYAAAPEHPFPAAAEDAHAVLCHAAVGPRRKLGWTGAHLFVGGIEAGGNLAAVGALMSRDRGRPTLSGQVLVMPMLDPSLTLCTQAAPLPPHWLMHGYRDYLPRPADRVHPYACPLQSSRMAGLPPALVVLAQGDPLAAEARAYADKLGRAGVPVDSVELEAAALANAQQRCDAASQHPSVASIAAFVAPYLATPSCSCPSAGSSK